MKFTQKNLDKHSLRYVPDRNYWLDEYGIAYYLKESCKECREPFLGRRRKIYCNRDCYLRGNNNPMKSKFNRKKMSLKLKNEICLMKKPEIRAKISGKNCWLWKNGEHLKGENNPSWLGGISKEPYAFEFDDELKESIKARDNYECQNPTCNGISKKLTVHHVNYDKKDFRSEHLITLCNSCNTKANFNRANWQCFYEEKLLCQ